MVEFSKILIANRGEIACRIARSAKSLGYCTVAVFSDADAGALHVQQADEAVRIGPPAAKESYLNIDALLAAAILTRADAVHPGYGFLSENAAFARACADAGLGFIGPPAAAIEAMGDKAKAKSLMGSAGIPCVAGYHEADQSNDRLMKESRRIGFPLMVKATAGGGGRGMRLVASESELGEALARARSEAAGAFGSDGLILEKAVADARHIEFQIFADQHGNIIHLGERECSIQRRHQKVIEEVPSLALGAELRAHMGEAAVAAAHAISYVGAGTVEFLLDPSGNFYFLEMNTRLQVEHAVTEAITAIDMVEWQLRIAAGEPLPLAQRDVRFRGHAIEARLYAEDPYTDFLPQSGTLADWRPATGDGVRIDHGVAPGENISPFYDPMLAKVIAHGATREEARRRLIVALEDTVVLGLNTNRNFLVAALRHPAFVAGEATTAFIERYFPAGSDVMRRPNLNPRIVALAAVLLFEARTGHAGGVAAVKRPWSSTGPANWPLRLTVGNSQQETVVAVLGPDHYLVALGDHMIEVSIQQRQEGAVRFTEGGVQKTARFAWQDDTLHLALDGLIAAVRETTVEISRAQRKSDSTELLAPMNGAIIAVHVKAGDRIIRGQRLMVLEAMKMQHEIRAPRDGVVFRVLAETGQQVATRQLLVELEAQPAASDQSTRESVR
jgi:geranyl-CoA carboxylase alpha subunit